MHISVSIPVFCLIFTLHFIDQFEQSPHNEANGCYISLLFCSGNLNISLNKLLTIFFTTVKNNPVIKVHFEIGNKSVRCPKNKYSCFRNHQNLVTRPILNKKRIFLTSRSKTNCFPIHNGSCDLFLKPVNLAL